MNDLDTLRAAIEAAREHLDCGENSCRFALRKGGMRTNGGCRCIDRGGAAPMVASSLAAVWKAAVAVSERMAWKPLDTAPRDGTEVLLSDPEWGRLVGVYDASFSTWVAPGYCLNPTLWMTIPEVEEKKGEGR